MVSIVIPAYNAENYIARCLNQIFQQTYKDFEIVVINDGSKDKTRKIVESYVADYPQIIRLVNKENGGLVSARRESLKYIRGEFVFFLDADDYIDNDALSLLCQYTDDYDIIIADFQLESPSGKIYPLQHKNHLLSAPNKCSTYASYLTKSLTPSLCGRLIRRNLLEPFKTPLEATIGEDVITNLWIEKNHHPRIKVINKPLYHYVQYGNSMINTKSKQTLMKRIDFIEYVLQFFSQNRLEVNVIDTYLSRFLMEEYYFYLRDGGHVEWCEKLSDNIWGRYWEKDALSSLSFWKRFILRSYKYSSCLGVCSRYIFVKLRNIVKK
jgi:glycosyltransferase involved in cell wall biosynthesis